MKEQFGGDGGDVGDVGQWLAGKCRKEGLSLRQAASKTGLSHATIADIINGSKPVPETLKRLAQAFGGDGHQRLALEDKLLVLAKYRTPRPEGEEPGELTAQLMDRLSQFSEPQLKIMQHFADFVSEMGGK